jgi:hypothetical protein
MRLYISKWSAVRVEERYRSGMEARTSLIILFQGLSNKIAASDSLILN